VSVIRFLILFFFQCLFVGLIRAQTDSLPVTDSTTLTDSSKVITDSVSGDTVKRNSRNTAWRQVAAKYPGKDFILQTVSKNSFFAFGSKSVFVRSNKKEFHGKEAFFYGLVAILLFFAFIKLAFPKYFGDLFQVAFRTTMKQRQIGEQLIQTPLPSLLLNLFFIITASLYISFVLKTLDVSFVSENFWLFYVYCFLGLVAMYFAKFLSLKFFGWLFNITETTNAYIFIVFMINKIIGICLLPVLVILAFTDSWLYQVTFTFAYAGILVLFAYRFILSYGLVRNQIRVNSFHFLLYLIAFEITPLLLIYKLLLLWF
jgi:hypothetical protein